MIELEVMEEFATRLRKRMEEKLPKDFNTSELVEITVKSLGGRIIGADSPEYNAIFGMLKIYDKRNFVVKLSLYSSPIRDNFEVAVQVGRYIMSYDEDDLPERVRTVMANRFAAALLMPRDLFLKVKNRYMGNVQSMAAHLQIPTEFVEERMRYCY